MLPDRNGPRHFADDFGLRKSRTTSHAARRVWRAAALALAVGLLIGPVWGQTVSTTGDANPVIPAAPTVNLSGIRVLLGGTPGGIGATGALNVLAGGNLTTAGIVTGYGGLGTGTANIDGAGSIVTMILGASPFGGLAIGDWGTGTMNVTNGASVVCTPANCPFSGIGGAAGSTGTLTINGTGSSVAGLGFLTVGNANVVAGYGTPGGTTTGTLRIENGATLGTANAAVSAGSSGALANGNEHTVGNVIIDGPGSKWTIDAANGAQAFLNVSPKANTASTFDVTNGGQLVINGGIVANLTNTPGFTLTGTSNTAGGTSTMNVNGAGSAVVINGDSGSIGVGRNGGTATLNITDGGKIYGGGTNGLIFMNVARLGSHATLNVDGAGSSLVLSGVGGAGTGSDNQGAFLTIGRENLSVGTANVTSGASILITDAGQNASAGSAGMQVGRDAGSSGFVTVSGTGSIITMEQTGAGALAGVGMVIGRAGHGEVTVTDGGTILIFDNGTSTAGGGAGFTIARDAGSSGLLTVSGVGSSVTVNQIGLGNVNPGITVGRAGTGEMLVTDGATVSVTGNLQRNFVVGNAAGGTGILTVENGAAIHASWFTVGNNGGTGTATIDNAAVNIDGITINSTNNEITGGGFRVGRGTGSVGTLNLVNGATVTIDTSTTTPEIFLGGTGVLPGGNGTVNMTGGSSVSFIGGGATPGVYIGHTGTGLWTMDGGSTLTMPADGTIRIGSQSTGIGQLEIHGGSSIEAGQLIVGGSGQGTVLMTSGTLTTLNQDISVGAFIVGDHAGSVGTFTQSGGTVSTSGRSLTLGADGGTGTYNLNTGNNPIITTGFISLGFSGTGIFNQQAGTTNNTGSIFIGADHGTYNLLGGNLNVVGGQGIILGTFGTGVFNQSGGTNTTTALSLGQHDVSSATYVMSGGDLVVNGQMLVGKGDSNLNPTQLNGLFQQSGGTVTAAQIFVGGYSDGIDAFFGTGRYELSGGTVHSLFTPVGWIGQGQVLQTGGTFNAGELQLGNAGLFANPDGLGGFTFYGSGTYDLQGGILNATSTTVSVFGQGTFNQSGASQHNITNNLIVGSQPALIEPNSGVARQGIYNLSGGTLNVGGNTVVGGGTDFLGEPAAKGTFNQSGGAHIITGDLIIAQGSSPGVSAGSTGAYVLSGGSLSVGTTTTVGGDGGPGLAGTGTFTHTGGTHTTTYLSIGGANATGTYNLSGTGVVNSGITYVGAGFGANGTLAQSGGTQNTSFLNVGFLGGATGTYNMSGGQATIADSMNVGGFPGSSGTVNHSGGNVDVAFILTVNGGGTYNLSGGALTTFRTVVGDNDPGATFRQTGGTHTVTENLIVGAGNGATGASGSYILTAGTVSVGSAIIGAAAGSGVGGTGALIMTGTSTFTASPAGSVIIGGGAGATGYVTVASGASLQAGSLLGIGHDGANSTGGTATLIVDGNVAATSIKIGAGGCVGGTGALHGNVVMDGPTAVVGGCPQAPGGLQLSGVTGILNPGRSPGRLVIDGGFDFIAGTIVLEVFEDTPGHFVTDQLVFTSANLANLDLTDMNIVFSFLGATNPEDFAPYWVLGTFFKVAPDANSNPALDAPISMFGNLDDLFDGSIFEAQAAEFVIEAFAFNPEQGVTSIVAVPEVSGDVPEPGTLLLVLLGTMLLVFTARSRRVQSGRWSQARASAVAAS